MNRFEGPGAREARIRYLDGDFQVMTPGASYWGDDSQTWLFCLQLQRCFKDQMS